MSKCGVPARVRMIVRGKRSVSVLLQQRDGTETEETCTQYNMLKLARYLFRWTGNATYADYYEKAITNGLLGTQRMPAGGPAPLSPTPAGPGPLGSAPPGPGPPSPTPLSPAPSGPPSQHADPLSGSQMHKGDLLTFPGSVNSVLVDDASIIKR